MTRIATHCIVSLLCSLILFSCDQGTPEIADTEETASPQIMGVSVWDRISTRSEPRRKSASTTLLSLGESFVYLDSFAIDSSYNNTKFLKVRLSDSTVAWAYGFATVLDAKPGVISKNVPLYLRPDLLTITDEELHAMEIVAVTEEWDNWIRVVNEKKENVGWIKKDFITYNTVDLAFALLAKRKLSEEDPDLRITNIEDLLENNPYPNSIFIDEVRTRLEAEKAERREQEQERDWEDQNRRRRNN